MAKLKIETSPNRTIFSLKAKIIIIIKIKKYVLERYWKEFGCLQSLKSLGIGQNDDAPQLKWNIVVPDWKKILLGMNCLYLGDPNHDKDKQ